jgi:hypothetical protein
MSNNVRYIVFLLDTKHKDHNGYVFQSYSDAKKYVSEKLEAEYEEKAVIGMFLEDNSKEMFISHVQSIGFKADKKNVNQLDLFV